MARSITDPDLQAEALAQVAGALAEAGQYQQAEAVARSITDPGRQAQALAQVAGALAGPGSMSRRAVPAGRGGGPLHHRPGPAGAGPGAGRGGAGRGRAA